MSRFVSEWLKATALFFLAVYRSCLSAFTGCTCRFEPTCSRYAQTAFERHSPARAFALTVRRLGRCHPLGSFGYDPVPERTTS